MVARSRPETNINPTLTEGIPLLTIYTSGNKLSKLQTDTETVHLLADSTGANKNQISLIKPQFLSFNQKAYLSASSR